MARASPPCPSLASPTVPVPVYLLHGSCEVFPTRNNIAIAEYFRIAYYINNVVSMNVDRNEIMNTYFQTLTES